MGPTLDLSLNTVSFDDEDPFAFNSLNRLRMSKSSPPSSSLRFEEDRGEDLSNCRQSPLETHRGLVATVRSSPPCFFSRSSADRPHSSLGRFQTHLDLWRVFLGSGASRSDREGVPPDVGWSFKTPLAST